MRTSALIGAKNSGFSKFMVFPCGQVANFFAILYGHLSWRAPYGLFMNKNN